MNSSPMISIVVATRNCADDLGVCLESIFSQTYRDIEVLIKDAGSSDGTLQLLERCGEKLAWWASEPDEGIYDAWNKAVVNCTGEWICFLGADDWFADPNAVAVMASQLPAAKQRGATLVYSRISEVSASRGVLSTLGSPPSLVGWQLRHGMPRGMPHTGMLHHRSLFEKVGLFNAAFRIAGDYEFLLRSTKGRPGCFYFCDSEPLLMKGADGVSAKHQVDAIKEFFKARTANKMRGFTLPWFLIYMRAILRRYIRGSIGL